MTYSVYQHWDPLKVCIVGRSYSPTFYSFITNSRVRSVMERIAQETEEDYQKLVDLLEKFGVKVLRPTVTDDYRDHLDNGKIIPPPMTPRDYSSMLGTDFYIKAKFDPTAATTLSFSDTFSTRDKLMWQPVLDHIRASGTPIINTVTEQTLIGFNSAMTTRVGKDIYLGTAIYNEDKTENIRDLQAIYPNHRWHIMDTGGHADGTYCPVKPGLIVSLYDIPTYANTFPGWEVVYLPGQSWEKVMEFTNLKHKNAGKWWVPGEELNDEFTEFVESWLNHWVGYVEETVFDVNMLVIDEKNVVCTNYNKDVFDAFDRHGITPHIINFRHRYFWDGGLHCITSDVHREGIMKDYFPERG